MRDYLLIASALLLSAGTYAGTTDPHPPQTPSMAVCLPLADDTEHCRLAWNMTGYERAHYRAERLDASTLLWTPVVDGDADLVLHVGPLVRVNALYRVMGCDDPQFTRNCVSSSAAWGVAVKAPADLPKIMYISDGSGEPQAVEIDTTSDRYILNSQYNVYRVVDLVNRVARADPARLPVMLPPEEPLAEADLDHQVQHNVQQQYALLREQYVGRGQKLERRPSPPGGDRTHD